MQGELRLFNLELLHTWLSKLRQQPLTVLCGAVWERLSKIGSPGIPWASMCLGRVFVWVMSFT